MLVIIPPMRRYYASLWRIGIAVVACIFLVILALYSYEGLKLDDLLKEAPREFWVLAGTTVDDAVLEETGYQFVPVLPQRVPRKIAAARNIGMLPDYAIIPIWLASDLYEQGIVTSISSVKSQKGTYCKKNGKMFALPYAEQNLNVEITGRVVPSSLQVRKPLLELSSLVEILEKENECNRGFSHNLFDNPYILMLITAELKTQKERSRLLNLLAQNARQSSEFFKVRFGLSRFGISASSMNFWCSVDGSITKENYAIVSFSNRNSGPLVLMYSIYDSTDWPCSDASGITRFPLQGMDCNGFTLKPELSLANYTATNNAATHLIRGELPNTSLLLGVFND